MAKEFSYEIIEEIAILGESNSGWTKELNKVAYNGGAAKFDFFTKRIYDLYELNTQLVKFGQQPKFSE